MNKFGCNFKLNYLNINFEIGRMKRNYMVSMNFFLDKIKKKKKGY